MRTTLKASLLGMSAAALLVGTALGAGPAAAATLDASGSVNADQSVTVTVKNIRNEAAPCQIIVYKAGDFDTLQAGLAKWDSGDRIGAAVMLLPLAHLGSDQNANVAGGESVTLRAVPDQKADEYAVWARCLFDYDAEEDDYDNEDHRALKVSRSGGGGGGGTSDPWGSLDGLFS